MQHVASALMTQLRTRRRYGGDGQLAVIVLFSMIVPAAADVRIGPVAGHVQHRAGHGPVLLRHPAKSPRLIRGKSATVEIDCSAHSAAHYFGHGSPAQIGSFAHWRATARRRRLINHPASRGCNCYDRHCHQRFAVGSSRSSVRLTLKDRPGAASTSSAVMCPTPKRKFEGAVKQKLIGQNFQ